MRRKRRRKRRNLEIEKDFYREFKQVFFRCKTPGQNLNPKEEAEYTLFIMVDYLQFCAIFSVLPCLNNK